MAFLDRIIERTQARIVQLNAKRTYESLLADGWQHVRRSLAAALRGNPPAVIAEIKKASPSKGAFRSDFNHSSLVAAYASGGAAALSVVTEPAFFQGNDRWLAEAKTGTSVPILRKDFILTPIQVAESAAWGADAVLLIARILSVAQLRELHDAARRAKLEVLFEAHDEYDLSKIAECEPHIVGVNARNLDSLAVDCGQFAQLAPRLPADVVAVAESGIASCDEIAAATKLGYHAFLIGETLVKSADPAETIRQLRSGVAK
jgi:indole-3-glycerol phosphate synthase